MRKSNTVKLGDVIKEYLKNNQRMNNKLKETQIIQAWPDLMGPAIANATQNIYIRNRTLFIYLNSAVIRNELFMMRQQLVKTMNDYVGASVIDSVLLK
ncbi:DUF721 domain-containing protein [Prolixibacteraceae bacterium JC049]|nr:DUF721 domain-containing protein [Prolixibacteraceae bacterium JC049]